MNFSYDAEQVIQLLTNQVAGLLRENAVLLSALQIAQEERQPLYDSADDMTA